MYLNKFQVLRFLVRHYRCYVLLRMLRSTFGAVRHNYECYEQLRMLRSLLCKCYVLTLLTYRCYVVLQLISDMLRLYNKCYDRVRQLFRCYEDLRMLRCVHLQMLRLTLLTCRCYVLGSVSTYVAHVPMWRTPGGRRVVQPRGSAVPPGVGGAERGRRPRWGGRLGAVPGVLGGEPCG